MKKNLRNILILLFPFLLMITTNEIVRPTLKEKPYSGLGTAAMNSADRNKDKCTWICHNDTNFCKEHHVKFLKPFYWLTDIMYFGVITLLKLTGSYALANIFFLVVLIPMFIWFFIIKIINMQLEINLLKRRL